MSDATLYTQKYLHWYAKQNTPKGNRLVGWMIRVGKHVELLIDYKDKAGWTEQKAIVLREGGELWTTSSTGNWN